MPGPDSLHALLPVASALALLLTAGIASLLYLALRPGAFCTPWKTVLTQLAAVSPWRGNDLPAFLLLVVAAQGIRRFLPDSVVWDMLAFQGVLSLGILGRARRKTRPFGASARWYAMAGQSLLRWLAILPVLWFATFAWQLMLRAVGHAPGLQNAIELFLATKTPGLRAFFIFFAVVLAPFAEEVLFRGLLLPLLVRRTGAAAGLLLTALGFAALHADAGTFIALGIFSVALSLAYARTGTLWVPVAMHALFNGTNLLLLLALARAGVV